MNNYVKSILSATSIVLLLSACSGGPSASKPAQVDKTLPKVSLNGYISDMSAAAFEWKPVSDSRVKGFIVYRNDPASKDPNALHQIDTVRNGAVTHYLDDGLTPGTLYYYRFATYSAKGHTSVASARLDVKTKPLISSVSFFSTAEAMPRAAKLVWRPHTDNSVVGYRLERRQNGTDKWQRIATIKGRLNAEYIDTGLEDDTRYEYRLKSITHDGIVSKPSRSAAVVTKAPPPPIETIRASQGKPGLVNIEWRASTSKELGYYRLYRAESKTGRYSLVADQLKTTHYSDKVEGAGEKYFYKVLAVSIDGLAGELDEAPSTMGSTLDAPNAPTELVAMVENATVQLTWRSTDERIVSYIVIKETEKGLFSTETKEFKNIRKRLMIDSSLKPDEEYTFRVVGVDKNGIRSAPSNSVHVKLEDRK